MTKRTSNRTWSADSTLGAGYSRATSQIDSLKSAGTYDSAIKQIAVSYAKDTGTTNLVYEDVAD